MIHAVLENNDDRVTQLNCTIACNFPGCIEYPVKDCKLLHYDEYVQTKNDVYVVGTDGEYSEDGLTVNRRYCLTFVAHIELSDGSTATYKEPRKCFTPGNQHDDTY